MLYTTNLRLFSCTAVKQFSHAEDGTTYTVQRSVMQSLMLRISLSTPPLSGKKYLYPEINKLVMSGGS